MDSQRKPERRTYGPELKRPYHRPKLEVYGDLGHITSTVGMKGNSDSGTGMTTNTH
jgi:hypothetical protein